MQEGIRCARRFFRASQKILSQEGNDAILSSQYRWSPLLRLLVNEQSSRARLPYAYHCPLAFKRAASTPGACTPGALRV
jgi:hypothetical protein